MEAEGEEELLFEVVFDFHDDEAVFLGDAFSEDEGADVVLYFFFVELAHAYEIDFAHAIGVFAYAGSESSPFVPGLK